MGPTKPLTAWWLANSLLPCGRKGCDAAVTEQSPSMTQWLGVFESSNLQFASFLHGVASRSRKTATGTCSVGHCTEFLMGGHCIAEGKRWETFSFPRKNPRPIGPSPVLPSRALQPCRPDTARQLTAAPPTGPLAASLVVSYEFGGSCWCPTTAPRSTRWPDYQNRHPLAANVPGRAGKLAPSSALAMSPLG